MSLLFDFNDANIFIKFADSIYGLVDRYCKINFLCSSVNSNILTPFYIITLDLISGFILITNLKDSCAPIKVFS